RKMSIHRRLKRDAAEVRADSTARIRRAGHAGEIQESDGRDEGRSQGPRERRAHGCSWSWLGRLNGLWRRGQRRRIGRGNEYRARRTILAFDQSTQCPCQLLNLTLLRGYLFL